MNGRLNRKVASLGLTSVLALVSADAPAQVIDVCGDVGGGFWGAGVYRSTCDLRVQDDNALRMYEGVILKMDAGHRFVVEGRLVVVGTNDNPVFITSLKDDSVGGDTNGDGDATLPEPGDWDGVFVDGSGVFDGESGFDFATIRYGGAAGGMAGANVTWSQTNGGRFWNSVSEFSGGAGLKLDTVAPSALGVGHSLIENNDGDGIRADGSVLQVHATIRLNGGEGIEVLLGALGLSNSIVSSNGSHGLYFTPALPLDSYSAAISYCTFSDNAGWAVYVADAVHGGWGQLFHLGGSGNLFNGIAVDGATVTGTSHWISDGGVDLPFVLMNDLVVEDGATLGLHPNNAFKFDVGVDMIVRGELIAGHPTLDGSVYFTSLRDDTIGGDTNGDGTFSTPAPGDWNGILVNGAGDFDGAAVLWGASILYGGNPAGAAQANLTFRNAAGGSSFSFGRLARSAGSGLRIEDSSPRVGGAMFYGNAAAGIFITGASDPNLSALLAGFGDGLSRFHFGDGGGINIHNDTPNTISATHGIWEYSSTSEVDSHIWDDDEDSALGPVLFEPWWPALVLADGFETGNLSNWSSTTP